MDEFYIGMVKLQAQSWPTKGWAICNGQLLQIRSNTALFAILGITYGGDGKTTFALPDMRDPANPPYHKGFGPARPMYYTICMQGIFPSRWW